MPPKVLCNVTEKKIDFFVDMSEKQWHNTKNKTCDAEEKASYRRSDQQRLRASQRVRDGESRMV